MPMGRRARRKEIIGTTSDLPLPLLRAAQWATIGGIMPGIIHDLNNTLNTVVGFADLWRTDARLPSELRSDLDEIVRAGLHARDLLAWLRELVEVPQSEPTIGKVVLSEVCEQALALLATPVRRRHLQVTLHHHPQTPFVRGCHRRLLMLVLCLLRNACDALPDGGNLIVRTYGDEGTVVLEVEDNGEGIPEAVQKQLFEPFVTTKPSGTGLGLILARTLALEIGGALTLTTQAGKGTKVTVRLPAA
jgi:signal transduction histidine kinase